MGVCDNNIKIAHNYKNVIGKDVSIINIEGTTDEKVSLQYAKEDPGFVPDQLIDILRESVVRIEIKNKKIISSGFFIKIKLKMKEYKFLLTCAHSIPQVIIDSKKEISIYYGRKIEEIKKIIILDSAQRFIKQYKELDVTIIEIKEEDNIYENRFLYPDLNYKMGLEHYLNAQVYTAGYPNVEIHKGDKHYSAGFIKQIANNGYIFAHTCDTKEGSSGGPIINYDKLVIGIHFGSIEEKKVNVGTFIGKIINELFLEEKNINLLMKEDDKRLYILKPKEKIYSVIFSSLDQRVHYSMACKNTDIFEKLEEKLYEVYPEYKDRQTFFICNGKMVNRFKNLEENGIRNSAVILLNTYNY